MYSGGIQQTGPYKPNRVSPPVSTFGQRQPLRCSWQGWSSGVGGDIMLPQICPERDFIPGKNKMAALSIWGAPMSATVAQRKDQPKLYGCASTLNLMSFLCIGPGLCAPRGIWKAGMTSIFRVRGSDCFFGFVPPPGVLRLTGEPPGKWNSKKW